MLNLDSRFSISCSCAFFMLRTRICGGGAQGYVALVLCAFGPGAAPITAHLSRRWPQIGLKAKLDPQEKKAKLNARAKSG
eukprot:5740934-Prymnesium_polylepis.1